MYNFDKKINRRHTDCMKWDTFADEDLLPMWVADMDFQCPPQVIAALSQRVEHGIFGYAGGYQSYYQAIIDWMKKRHNWEIKQEWIYLGAEADLPSLWRPCFPMRIWVVTAGLCV